MSGMDTGLNIIHSDESMVVVIKPAELLSVPGRGPLNRDCVVTRLRKLLPDIIDQPAVHRLDMQTSGLLVLARTAQAHRYLSRQFEHQLVQKRYIAVLERQIKPVSGTIILPLRLDPNNRPYQVFDPINGKVSLTDWRKISDTEGRSRIEFRPLTGRTHQLRLHAAHPHGLNAAIAGDRLYGSGRSGDTMLLHACYLSFQHPADGRSCTFFSEPDF
jgi:tRNA pseudouridine32 synthase/23S rRNA pseudouridine746 synthase